MSAADILEFRAMGTAWWIRADGAATAFPAVRALVEREEQRCSRFRPDSVLSCLNRRRFVHDARLAALVRRALRLRRLTGGAFDPTLGDAMRAAGYDRDFQSLPELCLTWAPPVERLRVRVAGERVALEGPGSLDLGGIAKGATVDAVAALLRARGCPTFCIDAGGDLRAEGPGPDGEGWRIGVGPDPEDESGATLAVSLRDAAVATSSTLRRRWATPSGTAHHILAPACGAPAASGVTVATVVAADAATADALATALIADPAAVLAAPPGIAALLCRDNAWVMTPAMEAVLEC